MQPSNQFLKKKQKVKENKKKMNNWSTDMEEFLENIRINSILFSNHHKSKYFFYKSYLKYFRIPTIFLSGINSVISVGLSAYWKQEYVSNLTCLLSLLCGIITSLELYLSVQTSMENELLISKEFYLLSVTIEKLLKLDRVNRSVSGKAFLDEQFSIYCKLIEQSNLMYENISDQLTLLPLQIKEHRTPIQTTSYPPLPPPPPPPASPCSSLKSDTFKLPSIKSIAENISKKFTIIKQDKAKEASDSENFYEIEMQEEKEEKEEEEEEKKEKEDFSNRR